MEERTHFLYRLLFLVLVTSTPGRSQDSSDPKRYNVLDIDLQGNLYLQKTALLCKDEIIKRLTDGTYRLAEDSTLGLTSDSPALNCRELNLKVPSAKSGIYWIDPDGDSHENAFQAYCDQETDGGGWTLVWSYTFTAYSSFRSGANAVTPRPSWPASDASTRVSTTPPLSETHYEAVDFGLWREIGNQTLIKSNINNWIVCNTGVGSLVYFQGGSISCKIAKQISQKCAGVVPRSFAIDSHGPYLSSSSTYYYFDGNTASNWPVHDSCGTSQENQLKEVANPHGNIFVR